MIRSALLVISLLLFQAQTNAATPDPVIAFPGPLPDFIRLAKKLSGNYIMTTDSGSTPALITLTDDSLALWHGFEGIPVQMFEIPFSELEASQKTKNDPITHSSSNQRFSEINKDFVRQIEVQTGLLSKMIQAIEIRREGPELRLLYRRSYFRRKSVLFGRWVLDTRSMNARYNVVRIDERLQKISDDPLPIDRFIDQVFSASSSPPSARIKNPQTNIHEDYESERVQVQARDHLELLDLTNATADDEPAQQDEESFGEVITLPSPKRSDCERTLDP